MYVAKTDQICKLNCIYVLTDESLLFFYYNENYTATNTGKWYINTNPVLHCTDTVSLSTVYIQCKWVSVYILFFLCNNLC